MSEPADDGQQLLITKHAVYLEMPEELLMDYGVIPDTRVHRPISRRTRLRWRIEKARARLAAWAYRRIAGYDVPEGDY